MRRVGSFLKRLLPAASHAAQSAGIQVTRPILRFFAPAGATRCTNGVKFGTEGPLLRAKFHSIGATIRV